MLNLDVGRQDRVHGRNVIRTERGRSGHAIYGPYVELPPGRYAVEFNIALDGHAEGDSIAAVVDVVTDFGGTVLAREELPISRLGDKPIRLTFQLESTETVEYRVFSPGTVPLIVEEHCAAAPIDDGEDPEVALASARFPNPASPPPFFLSHKENLRSIFEKGIGVKVTPDDVVLSAQGVSFYARVYDDLRFIDEIIFRSAYNYSSGLPTCVIDIGMNIGLVSLLQASKPFVKEVHSFELMDVTYNRAKANLALNPGLSRKIQAYNFGIAGRDERKTILINDFSDSGCLSVYGSGAGTPVEVDIRSASAALGPIIAEARRKGLEVVAKIDCEGAEFDIFDDLEAHGLFPQISAFMVEWHQGQGKNQHDLFRPLLENGFVTFDVSPPNGNGFFYAARTR